MTDLERVLDWVNETRATLNLPPRAELPKGYKRSMSGCVIARAFHELGSVLACGCCGVTLPHDQIPVPDYVAEFMIAFDGGSYPDLDVAVAALAAWGVEGVQAGRIGKEIRELDVPDPVPAPTTEPEPAPVPVEPLEPVGV